MQLAIKFTLNCWKGESTMKKATRMNKETIKT